MEKLPPNDLPDGASLEKKIEEKEKQNRESTRQIMERVDKGVGMLLAVKKGSEKAVINNSHHVAATMSISMFTIASGHFSSGEYKQAIFYALIGTISYVLQNFFHALKLKMPGKANLSDWVQEGTRQVRMR